MATCLFRSSLAFRLQTFLETRRADGRDDVGTQKILIYLDRFLMSELKPGRPITREIVEHLMSIFMPLWRCSNPKQFQVALQAAGQLQERSDALDLLDRQWQMRIKRLDYQTQLAQRR